MSQKSLTMAESQQLLRDREAQRRWRKKMRAGGLCGECFEKPAGGEGGTLTRCPECAEKHRLRNRAGYVPKKPGRPKGSKTRRSHNSYMEMNVYVKPEPSAVVELLIKREELRAKMKPVRVTWQDIRRQSVC